MVELKAKKSNVDLLIKSMKLLSRMNPGLNDTAYFRMVSDYYMRVRDARQNGDFVVAHTNFLPVELLHAMDIVPLDLEFTGFMMSLFTGNCGEILSHTREMGYAPEICSVHRLIAGAVDMGIIPPVDAVISSNLVCDNGIKTAELIMGLNRCPGFIFDYPFHATSAARKFIISEMRSLIDFLEKVSGHKTDWAKLSAAIVEINEQLEALRLIHECCRKVPSPFFPGDFPKLEVTNYMLAGMPELTRYYQGICRNLAESVSAGKGFANPERFRLMGLMIPPWYLQSKIDGILQENGAALVCYPNILDWRQEIHLDPERPLESIAQKWAACPPLRTFGPFDERALGPLRQSVKDYRIDGVLNLVHLGCRQTGATIKIIKDLLNGMDIPMMNIDCDMVDKTVTSEDEMRQKMEQFFELLEDRKESS